MSGPIVTPTRGESLLLWRRRADLNQVEAAAIFKTSPDIYREWEADRRTGDQPRKHLGALKLHEVCLIMRRRAGQTQRELAKALGCTRLWVISMESGEAPVDRLRQHWGI